MTKWKEAILKVGEKVMVEGGWLEFRSYKDSRKRKPIINYYPPKQEYGCEEEEIIE